MKGKLWSKISLKITVIYALVGWAWILLSDRFLNSLGLDHRTLTIIQTQKGWAYVLATSLLLYGLISHTVRALNASKEKLSESYLQLGEVHEELTATHEELMATEEELRQQFEELQGREKYYRGVYDGVSSGILVFDQNGDLIHSNNSARQLLGCNFEARLRVRGQDFSWRELVLWLIRSTEQEKNFIIEVLSKKGHKRLLLAHLDNFGNSVTREENIVLTLVDHTDEQRIEIKTSILNEIDQMVLVGASLKSISQTLCQRLTEKLDFSFVWIGSKEEDGRVEIQASAGIVALEHMSVRWDDSGYSQGAAGRAIREGKAQILSVEGNPDYKAWNNFKGSGICTVAAFPLLHEGKIIGVFVLYSNIPSFFEASRMTIYSHFTNQLTLALAHVREREYLERFRILAEQTHEAIFFVSSDGRIMDANEAAETMYGYTREELLNLDLRNLGTAEDELPLEDCLRGNREEVQCESVHLTKKGKAFPVEISLTGADFKGQAMLLGVVRDISERKEAEKAIWHQAHYDTLTGLPNRIYFDQLLKKELSQASLKGEKCAVIFLDLDQFKLVNDTMGHNIGDQLLQLVAKRIENLGLKGTLGRPGGDEFLILLHGLKQAEEVALFAEKVIKAFEAPFSIEKKEIFITPSLGISLFPKDGEDQESLLKMADTAMYHAKALGRNNYQFYKSELNERIQEKAALGHLLHKAVERGEFCLRYQPQVDIQTGRIAGMEALIRWNSPLKGEVSPGEFIPIAEETGLIVPIGAWVLRSACVQNLKWQEKGYPPLTVSVNISSRQFEEPMFIESVAEVLKETGLDPQCLEIEITESMLLENIDRSIRQLQRLKELGVTVAIDDFGTGYSSLNYLRKLPIDTLKIDQSFIRDIGKNESGEAIVIAIIQLAHNLNLKVIAEGVETEGQLAFLKEENCNEMQGYLFSRPLPLAQIDEYLKKEKVSFA